MLEKNNNKRISLLYITQSFGGVEVYIRQIIEYIDYSKFELSIIAPPNKNFKDYCTQKGITYFSLNMLRGFSPQNDFKAYKSIRRIVKKVNPDIVHLHSSKAGVLGRLALKNKKCRVVFTPHGISYLSFKGIKRAIFFLCEVFMKKYTDKVLTCSYSEKMKLYFEVGIPDQNITPLCNSIPIPDTVIEKRDFSSETFIHLGSIMRLTAQKNPLMYIDVAKELSKKYDHIHFSILGAGMTDDLKDEVYNRIHKYNLTNKFKILNWSSQATSQDYLDSLDIFILPSLFEGFPLSPLEAMSRGVPCVLSKEDGCKDLLNNAQNGFSCITTEQYVDAVSRLIDNKEERSRIRIEAFDYIKRHHNIKEFISNLEEYYTSLV